MGYDPDYNRRHAERNDSGASVRNRDLSALNQRLIATAGGIGGGWLKRLVGLGDMTPPEHTCGGVRWLVTETTLA